MRHTLAMALLLTVGLSAGPVSADDLQRARSDRQEAERDVDWARQQLNSAEGERARAQSTRDLLIQRDRDLPGAILQQQQQLDHARYELPTLEQQIAEIEQTRRQIDEDYRQANQQLSLADRDLQAVQQQMANVRNRIEAGIDAEPSMMQAADDLVMANAELQETLAFAERTFAESQHGMIAQHQLNESKSRIDRAQRERNQQELRRAQQDYNDAWQDYRRLHDDHLNWYPEYREAVLDQQAASATAESLRKEISQQAYGNDIEWNRLAATAAEIEPQRARLASSAGRIKQQLDDVDGRLRQATDAAGYAINASRNAELQLQSLVSEQSNLRSNLRMAEDQYRYMGSREDDARRDLQMAMNRLQNARQREEAEARRPKVSDDPPNHHDRGDRRDDNRRDDNRADVKVDGPKDRDGGKKSGSGEASARQKDDSQNKSEVAPQNPPRKAGGSSAARSKS